MPDRPLKILLTDPHEGGGGQVTYLTQLATRFTQLGHEVHIGCKPASVLVDKAAQAAMHEGLDRNANCTLHDYPGRDHAFARVGGEHYDERDATLANQRTLDFFSEHLT